MHRHGRRHEEESHSPKSRRTDGTGWGGVFLKNRQHRYSRYCLSFSASLHPLNESDQQPDIFIRHGINVFDRFLLGQGGFPFLVEKLHGCHAQVFADIQKFTHGRQRPAGGDALFNGIILYPSYLFKVLSFLIPVLFYAL